MFTPSSTVRESLPGVDNRLLQESIANSVGASRSCDVTVAIPTYNGAQRLPKVLEELRSQLDTDGISWEVIVADNNSTDRTATVVRNYQQDWSAQSTLRYCFAARQGAAFARQRAVEVARGELVAFLDDDNVPALDWVKQAYQFAHAHPQVGAFGSQIHGEFEGETPPDFKRISCFLAIIERGKSPRRYEPKSKILPPGAGLVVRRQVWLEHVPKCLFLNHKGKGAGLASEDLEAVLHIQKSGWEVWYNPAMVVHHQIPNQRLKREYLLKLFRCIGLSSFYVRMLGIKNWQRPFLLPLYIANDWRKLALHYVEHGRPKEALTLLDACTRERLESTVVSPVFLLKKALQDTVQTCHDHLRLPRREYWLQQLTQAFEQNQFQLYQQPVIALTYQPHQNRQNELLLRLIDQTSSELDEIAVTAGQFLPIAQHYGLMATIDRWVIRKFLDSSQNGVWNTAIAPTTYSINLSTASVCDATLAGFIDQQIACTQIEPNWLCFEINEATALAYPQQTLKLAQALHVLGCQVAVDDVSWRRTTPDILQSLPVKYLKLNPGLVKAATQQRPSALQQTAQILRLAQQQGIHTVAKGIETQAMLDQVQKIGIPYGQGYQISKPAPLNYACDDHSTQ